MTTPTGPTCPTISPGSMKMMEGAVGDTWTAEDTDAYALMDDTGILCRGWRYISAADALRLADAIIARYRPVQQPALSLHHWLGADAEGV